jgi:glycosyltransferase involved in cell wall biosynthesis
MGNRPVILLVAEPVDRAGGILTFCRLTAACLRGSSPVRVISRADGADWPVVHNSAAGSTARFVVHALRYATTGRGSVIVATHLNLAPLAFIAAKLSRGRFVLVLYGQELKVARSLVRCFAARQADVTIAISRATARDGEMMLGLAASTIRVVTPGVDLPATSPRTEHTPHARLLTVTRLVDAYKHVESLIAALREPALSSAHLTVVGEGPRRPGLEKLAQALGVSERVCFAGSVDGPTLDRIYQESDLFILPSTGEGFGLVYAEAMARGLPCIGARGCGSEDAIIDGATGLLLDDVGPAAIAAAATRILEGSQYATLSASAARWASTELSANAFGRRLAAALESVDR